MFNVPEGNLSLATCPVSGWVWSTAVSVAGASILAKEQPLQYQYRLIIWM